MIIPRGICLNSKNVSETILIIKQHHGKVLIFNLLQFQENSLSVNLKSKCKFVDLKCSQLTGLMQAK